MSRIDEFLKNASPEVRAMVEGHKDNLKNLESKVQEANQNSIERPTEISGNPNAPEPKLDARAQSNIEAVSNQPNPEGRTVQAMNQKAQAQAAEQGKEATKSGASIEESKATTPPAKEPER